jgi:hypothetical protein
MNQKLVILTKQSDLHIHFYSSIFFKIFHNTPTKPGQFLTRHLLTQILILTKKL